MDPYETPDLNLAAGLVTSGYGVSHVESRASRVWAEQSAEYLRDRLAGEAGEPVATDAGLEAAA